MTDSKISERLVISLHELVGKRGKFPSIRYEEGEIYLNGSIPASQLTLLVNGEIGRVLARIGKVVGPERSEENMDEMSAYGMRCLNIQGREIRSELATIEAEYAGIVEYALDGQGKEGE